MLPQHNLQVLARHDSPITSPTIGPNGDLFTISISGDIFRYSGNAEYDNEFPVEQWGHSGGQPLGLEFEPQDDGREGDAFVCDAAHQCIYRIFLDPNKRPGPYVKEYEQQQFLGPNSLCFSRQTGMLYFTDSGPFGETSLQNPRGSVFAITRTSSVLVPLIHNVLAYPCGIALSPDEKNIYVAETAMNRILRLSQHPPQVFHCSVFYQLSGRFGPTALAVSASGDIFVAHFDFAENTDNGRIVVIDPSGEITGFISVPGPEITGLCITPDQRYLIITERNTCSVYRHPLMG